jgi:hypothetical protein
MAIEIVDSPSTVFRALESKVYPWGIIESSPIRSIQPGESLLDTVQIMSIGFDSLKYV